MTSQASRTMSPTAGVEPVGQPFEVCSVELQMQRLGGCGKTDPFWSHLMPGQRPREDRTKPCS